MFVKSRSDWYSLDWTGGEHYRYCCQWMEKASPCLCSHSGPTVRAILLLELKNGQLDKMSAKVSEMETKCVFTHMLITQSYRIG